MKKQTKLILAIVSAVLCVAIVVGVVLFVLASCGDDGGTTVRRKKKVVIVKKPSTTQTEDTSPEEEDKIYEEEYEEEMEEEEEEEEEEEKVGPVYEVDLEERIYNPINEQMGMAIYHFTVDAWDNALADHYGAKEEDFLTYYHIESIEELRAVGEKGGLGWWWISSPFPDRQTEEIPEFWKANIISKANAYKKAGVWKHLAGFETEELCTKITNVQFRNLTKFLRDSFPDKRIFACLSTYEVRGTAPSGYYASPMTYDTYGYVTDIGYDWYSHLEEDRYRELVETMLTNLGRRENVRIWFFPTAYRFSNTTGEDFLISHLNICYKLLLEQKCPGGLYLYSWKTYSGKHGIADFLDPNGEFRYRNWANRAVEVGKELKANSYRFDYSNYN